MDSSEIDKFLGIQDPKARVDLARFIGARFNQESFRSVTDEFLDNPEF